MTPSTMLALGALALGAFYVWQQTRPKPEAPREAPRRSGGGGGKRGIAGALGQARDALKAGREVGAELGETIEDFERWQNGRKRS